MATYSVILSRQPANENPLELVGGQEVMIDGSKNKVENNREGWAWCISSANSGWVPEDMVTIVEEVDNNIWKASVNGDFSGKELTIQAGDIIKCHQRIGDWIWGEREVDGETGWLPLKNLKLI